MFSNQKFIRFMWNRKKCKWILAKKKKKLPEINEPRMKWFLFFRFFFEIQFIFVFNWNFWVDSQMELNQSFRFLLFNRMWKKNRENTVQYWNCSFVHSTFLIILSISTNSSFSAAFFTFEQFKFFRFCNYSRGRLVYITTYFLFYFKFSPNSFLFFLFFFSFFTWANEKLSNIISLLAHKTTMEFEKQQIFRNQRKKILRKCKQVTQ